jgi:hypothetical protein
MTHARFKRVNVSPGGLDGLIDSLSDGPKSVLVGVIDQTAKYATGTGIEEAALRNINGTVKIPARNWIEGFLQSHGKKYTSLLKKMARSIISKKVTSTSALAEIGRKAQSDMRKLIVDWSEPPNAPTTVKRKGFNDPLVHTKVLQKEIKWKYCLDK